MWKLMLLRLWFAKIFAPFQEELTINNNTISHQQLQIWIVAAIVLCSWIYNVFLDFQWYFVHVVLMELCCICNSITSKPKWGSIHSLSCMQPLALWHTYQAFHLYLCYNYYICMHDTEKFMKSEELFLNCNKVLASYVGLSVKYTTTVSSSHIIISLCDGECV